MIAHYLKIGQRIFDTCDGRWGTILLIQGQEKDANVIDGDEIILYKPDDSDGECETTADMAYPLDTKVRFKGKEVCLEINEDEFDEDHDYDFFCPETGENCWYFECE